MVRLEDLPYRPCAGVVLTRGDGRVFAGERIDTPGAWQMPQGGIDKGESPAEAGRRELWEETGVTSDLAAYLAETADWLTYDLPPDLAGSLWGGRFRGQKQKWLCFRFEGRDEDVNIATGHPEFSAWRWLPPEELKTLIVPFKRDIYDRVLAEFAPQIGR